MIDSVKVEITTSVDLSNIQSRLDGLVLEVFEKHGQEMKKAIQNRWRGWKYKGRDMSTVGNSLKGWGYEIQATEGKRDLIFFNKALTHIPKGSKRKTRHPYAAYVKRHKGAEEEWIVMRDMLFKDYLPVMIKDVIAALGKGMTRGPTKRVRENKQSTTTKAEIIF